MSFFKINASIIPNGESSSLNSSDIMVAKTYEQMNIDNFNKKKSKNKEVEVTAGFDGDFSQGASGFTKGNYTTSRFTSPNERLDRDTLIDDITPKGDIGLIKMFDRIYKEDAVCGSATDLIAQAPWSNGTLSGIADPSVMKDYEEAFVRFNPEVRMPDITRDYLKHGFVPMLMSFDSDLSTWKNFIPLDAMYCEVIPVPIDGYDPLVNLTASPELKFMLSSKDKRFAAPLADFPASVLKDLKNKEKAEIDPHKLLFLRRKVSLTDWKGTSLYNRIIPYYALERALLNSTIAASRRRTRSILHITAGTEDWTPTSDQLNDIVNEFAHTEEDPVGAMIVTRNGIECNEVKAGGDFWKISEESDYITSMKLKALGVSESLLSSEATINNVDASKSMFVESERLLRNMMTKEIFTNKVFEILARAKGYFKTSQADIDHHVRTKNVALSVEEAMAVPKSELLIPMIHWDKTLSPESDESYLSLLSSAKEAGLPITLKMIASAAGIDINMLEQTLPEDIELRARFNKLLPKPKESEEGEGGGFGSFGSLYSDDYYKTHTEVLSSMILGNILNDNPKEDSVLGIKYKTLNTIVAYLTKDNNSQKMLRDDKALSTWLHDYFNGDDKAVESTRYLLTRMGFANCIIDETFLNNLCGMLYEASKKYKDDLFMQKKVQEEVKILCTILKYKSTASTSDYKKDCLSEDIAIRDYIKSSLSGVNLSSLQNSSKNKYLYSGI